MRETQLIAESLTRCVDAKPSLILTHTNAGVVALRERLDRAGVPSKAYRLLTIDGFAMRLVSMFPKRAECDPALLTLAHPATDYPNIRVAAAKLLKAGHVNDIISASYARLIIDEYQDCSIRQHAIAWYAAKILSTCVLGDPMQAIFGFNKTDDLAKWDDHVCTYFPVVSELATPWRWINAGAEALGEWLLEVRRKLLSGEPIDLRQRPAAVTWIKLDGKEDHKRRLNAARVNPPTRDGSVLIIGYSKSADSRNQFASQTPVP